MVHGTFDSRASRGICVNRWEIFRYLPRIYSVISYQNASKSTDCNVKFQKNTGVNFQAFIKPLILITPAPTIKPLASPWCAMELQICHHCSHVLMHRVYACGRQQGAYSKLNSWRILCGLPTERPIAGSTISIWGQSGPHIQTSKMLLLCRQPALICFEKALEMTVIGIMDDGVYSIVCRCVVIVKTLKKKEEFSSVNDLQALQVL